MVKNFKLKTIILLVVYLIRPFDFSHFRGGLITWRPLNSSQEDSDITTILITTRFYWRLDYSQETRCDQNTILNNGLIGEDDYLLCDIGCPIREKLMSTKVVCTDFSNIDVWSGGERTNQLDFKNSYSNFQAIYASGDWISLINGGGSWEVRVKIDIKKRNDTGKINSSPITSMSPIVRVNQACNNTIQIPIEDRDGDRIICRWAGPKECGGVCSAPSESILDPEKCILYFKPDKTGYYGVTIQIEDFPNSQVIDLTKPFSSVPLQFLILSEKSNQNCTSLGSIYFHEDTAQDQSCIGIPKNSTYTDKIIVYSESEVVEITTQSPSGLIKSDIMIYGNKIDNLWYVNLTWTPSANQQGIELFCYKATNKHGLATSQVCITFVVGVQPVNFFNPVPIDLIYPNQTRFTINSDRPVFNSPRISSVKIFDSSNNLIQRIFTNSSRIKINDNNNNLEINTDFEFVEKSIYYILFDRGVAITDEYCGIESNSIKDNNFWRFRVKDITPPIVKFDSSPRTTNSSAKISWIVNEESTFRCTLNTPTSIALVQCNLSVEFDDLNEGWHVLEVDAEDLEGNKAPTLQHSWFVDLTPPIVKFTYLPPQISNNKKSLFQYQCTNEIFPCKFVCLLDQTDPQTCPGSSYYNTEEEKSYNFSVYGIDEANNTGNPISFSFIIDLTPPTISTLPTISVECGQSLSPNFTGYPTVYDNIDQNPKIYYKDDADENSCSITRTWFAQDSAGNIGKMIQKINLLNSDEPIVTGKNEIAVACNNLNDILLAIKEPNFSISQKCTSKLFITYKDSDDITKCGMSITRYWSIKDSCSSNSVSFTQTIRILNRDTPLTPFNGELNVDIYKRLQWYAYPKVRQYRVYLWREGVDLTYLNFTQTSNTFFQFLPFYPPNTRLFWKLEYLQNDNTSDLLPSPIWAFQTRSYADLLLNNIQLPFVAFSGNSVKISYSVTNIGNVSTSTNSWIDSLYVSKLPNFDSSTLVSSQRQNRILYQNDGYSNTLSFQLKDDQIGTYYLFINVDSSRELNDFDYSNNIKLSTQSLEVKLTPPPNLIIDTLVIPLQTFSAQELQLSFTVKNIGLGPTKATKWSDIIILSGKTNSTLKIVSHTGILLSGDSYRVDTTVMIPHAIYGNYTIIVQTDFYDQVFEFNSKDDNFKSELINIIVSPPPDLIVDLIQTESFKYSTNDLIKFNYTVKNNGPGETYETYWSDLITLTNAETKITYKKLVQNNYGKLASMQLYTKEATFVIDQEMSKGLYVLSVLTDYKNDVFEYIWKDNNENCLNISIEERYPDLEIVKAKFEIEKTVKYGNTLKLNYQVMNKGKGTTAGKQWIDRVFLSYSNSTQFSYNLNPFIDLLNKKELISNETVNLTTSFQIPNSFYGKEVFLIIRLDQTNSLIETNKTNNIFIANFELEKCFSLLSIEFAEFSIENDSLVTNWTIKNTGNIEINSKSWIDRLVVKSIEAVSNYMHIYDTKVNRLVGPNETYSLRRIIDLPRNVYGFLNISLTCDYASINSEKEINKTKSKLIRKPMPLVPDLVAKSLDCDLKANNSLRYLMCKWTVINNQNSMESKLSWFDKLQLTSIDNNRILEELTFSQSYMLMKYEGYEANRYFYINPSINKSFKVRIIIDHRDQIFELNKENNQLELDKTFNIVELDGFNAQPQLLVNQLRIDIDKIETRVPFILKYNTSNVGKSNLTYTFWTDGVYLTFFELNDKQSIISNGLKIDSIKQSRPLDLNTYFETNSNITLPSNLLNSNYNYLCLVIDINNVFDKMEQKNLYSVIKLKENNQIQIIEGPRPDLKLAETNLDINRNYSGGEQISLSYRVENIGNGSTSFGQDFYWYDAVYLSIDAFIDPFDIKLSSIKVNKILNKNDSYLIDLNLTLPFDLDSANYYLIISIDNTKLVDDSDYKNNIENVIIYIKQIVSFNLAIIQINTDKNEYNNEESLNANWTIINNGSQSVSGIKCDSVYLSKDEKWDIDDVELEKPICSQINYLPYENNTKYDYKKFFKLPYVTEGEYYALIKIRTNIKQIYLNNNEKSTESKLNIKSSYLYFDKNNSVITETNKFKVFKIVKNDSDMMPYGETLIIKLYTDQQTSINTLFVKHNNPARESDFDFISEPSYDSSQNSQIVISSIKTGDYYLGILNSEFTDSEKSKEITVYVDVKIAKFEILDVQPKHVLKNFNTTLRIKGTKFGKNLNVFLESASVRVEAIRIERISSELVYATFLIKNEFNSTESSMNLTLIDTNTMQTISYSNLDLKNEGIPGRLKIKVNSPTSTVRTNENILWSLVVENAGDSDLSSPLLLISTDGNSNITMINDDIDLVNHDKYYLLYAFNQNGPVDTIQAKSYVKFDFQTKPGLNYLGSSEFKINLVNDLDYNEFELKDLKEELRPFSVSETVWNAVWDNRESIFNLKNNYYQSMVNLLKCFTSKHRYIYSFVDLIHYQLDYSNNRLTSSNFHLASVNDLIYSNLNTIDLTRIYSNLITSRRRKGAFGFGWFNNILDVRIARLNDEFISLFLYNEDITLIRTKNTNEYLNSIYKAYTDSNFINLIDNNLDDNLGMVYQFELKSPYRLTRLIYNLDDVIDFQYNQLNQIYQINVNKLNHSVRLDYTSASTVKLIQLYNKNNLELLNQISYKYDESNQYLKRVSLDLDKKTLSYVYDRDGDLIRILNDDTGEYVEYSYDIDTKFLSNIAIYDNANVLLKNVAYDYKDNLCQLQVNYQPEDTSILNSFSETFQVIELKTNDVIQFNTISVNNDINKNNLYLNGEDLVFKNYFDQKTNTFEQTDANNDKRKLVFDNSYDKNLVKIIDGNSNAIEISYYKDFNDSKSLIKDITYPDGKQLSIYYMKNTQSSRVLIDKIKNRDKSEISFKYDSLDRIQSKYVNNEMAVEFSYSENNSDQINKLSNMNGETKIEFDKNGLPTKVIYPDSNYIEYEYDSQLRRISIKTNLDYHLRYKYDNKNQLIECIDGTTNKTIKEYKYDSKGRLVMMINGDKSYVSYQYYEKTNYPKKIESFFSTNQTIHAIEYFFNEKGQRTKVIRDSEIYTYKYDSIGQIVQYEKIFMNNFELVTYSYDKNLNRKQEVINGTSNNIYVTNNLNQYVQIDGQKFEYDDLGNLISDGVHTYKYNSESKCIQIDDCKLKYDHFNNLNSIECLDGKISKFIVDPFGINGFDIISEIMINGNQTEIVHYLNSFRNGLIGLKKDDQYYFYSNDIDSNILSLHYNSILFNSYSYDPFGRVVSSNEKIHNRFKFSGYYGIFELTSNIYLNRARLYDSSISRFLSIDPSSYMGSTYNLYVFCNNNPLELKDPDGKVPVLPFIAAGAIIGSITNTAVYGVSAAIGLESFSLGGLTSSVLNGAVTGAGVTGGAIIGGPLGFGVTFGVGAISGAGSNYLGNLIDNKPNSLSSNAINGVLNGIGALFPTTMLGYNSPIPFGKIRTNFKSLLGFNSKSTKTAKSLYRTLGFGNIIGAGLGYLGNWVINWIASFDPNDIIGPDSYGDRNFVSKNELFIYKIRFENDENATAPAQKVFIKYKPSEYLDIKSLRLLSFGYDDFIYEYNYPTSFSQFNIDYPKDPSLKIRIQSGLNIITNEITWSFESIDVLTGLPPKNPEIGFLPPNNGTSGQGFVVFSLNVKKNVAHLTQIDAEADIIFDSNEPITTPKIFHTIDDKPPTVQLELNTDLMSQGQLAFNILKSDNGSGVESVDIYEWDKENNNLIFILNTKEDFAILPFNQKRDYVLKSVGKDNVGNVQNLNDLFELNVSFDYKIECPNNCTQNGLCDFDTGVCKCNANYALTDCSFYYDGNNANLFDFRVNFSNYEERFKSFNLNFYFNSTLNFDEFIITIVGFPIGTNFSSNHTLLDEILTIDSLDDIGVILPQEYYGQLKLSIKITLKYSLLDFSETRDLLLLVEKQSFTPLFEIKKIECTNTSKQQNDFKIYFYYDLIDNFGDQYNASINVGLIDPDESVNVTLTFTDYLNKNGSIELTYIGTDTYVVIIQANIILADRPDSIFTINKELHLKPCEFIEEDSDLTTENLVSSLIDKESTTISNYSTEHETLTSIDYENSSTTIETSTSKTDTNENGSNNKILIIALSISGVVIVILSICTCYWYKYSKKRMLRATEFELEKF